MRNDHSSATEEILMTYFQK